MIRRVRGFESVGTASATIKGFEIMRMIRRSHCMLKEPGAKGEVRFVNNLFGIAA
jgi:transposase-like protein